MECGSFARQKGIRAALQCICAPKFPWHIGVSKGWVACRLVPLLWVGRREPHTQGGNHSKKKRHFAAWVDSDQDAILTSVFEQPSRPICTPLLNLHCLPRFTISEWRIWPREPIVRSRRYGTSQTLGPRTSIRGRPDASG